MFLLFFFLHLTCLFFSLFLVDLAPLLFLFLCLLLLLLLFLDDLSNPFPFSLLLHSLFFFFLFFQSFSLLSYNFPEFFLKLSYLLFLFLNFFFHRLFFDFFASPLIFNLFYCLLLNSYLFVYFFHLASTHIDHIN